MAYGTPNKPKSYYDRLAKNYLAAGIEKDPEEMRIAAMAAQPVAEVRKTAAVMPTPGTPIATPVPAPRQAQQRPAYNPFPGGLPGGMTSPGQLDKGRSYPIGGQPQADPQADKHYQSLTPEQKTALHERAKTDPAVAAFLESSPTARAEKVTGFFPAGKPTAEQQMTAKENWLKKSLALRNEFGEAAKRGDMDAKQRIALQNTLQFDPEAFGITNLGAQQKVNVIQVAVAKGMVDPATAWKAISEIADAYVKDEISPRDKAAATESKLQAKADQTTARQTKMEDDRATRDARAEDWKQHGLQEKRIERAQKVLDKLEATDPADLTAPQKGRIKELQRQIKAAQRVRNEIESRLGGTPPEDVIDEDLPEEGQKPSVWNPFPAMKPGTTGQPGGGDAQAGTAASPADTAPTPGSEGSLPTTTPEAQPAQQATTQPATPAAAASPVVPHYVEGVVQGAIKDLDNGRTWDEIKATITAEEYAAMTPDQKAALKAARDKVVQ